MSGATAAGARDIQASSASVEVSLDTGAAREGGPSVNRATVNNTLDIAPTRETASTAAPEGTTPPSGRGWPVGHRHSQETRIRQGASKLGIDPMEYAQHINNGEKWCSGHRLWESRENFGRHRNRADGLANPCREAMLAYVVEYQRLKREAS